MLAQTVVEGLRKGQSTPELFDAGLSTLEPLCPIPPPLVVAEIAIVVGDPLLPLRHYRKVSHFCLTLGLWLQLF